ncbi:MAG: hypothetical protein JSW26_03280, partial [Desulfobacterales bacterium]
MKKTATVATVFLLLSAIFIASLQAETGTVDQVQAETETVDQLQTEAEIIDQLPDSVETPGRIDGSGTYFEITNSKYLNISLASSAEIKLTLESVPRVVTMVIESAAGAA